MEVLTKEDTYMLVEQMGKAIREKIDREVIHRVRVTEILMAVMTGLMLLSAGIIYNVSN